MILYPRHQLANVGLSAGESAGKAMSRIYGNIGFKGLWNGLPVRIFMIGTLTVSLIIDLAIETSMAWGTRY